MGMLNYSDVKGQSEAVFKQFGESVWIPNAKENAKLEHRPIEELHSIGLGRCIVIAAMGESTEEQVDVIRAKRDKFHLAVNDKLFGYFIDRGIVPDFVMISDANIPFRWLEKHVEATKNVRLIATPYANTQWTKAWLGPRYFYINMDIIRSERYFFDMFPDTRIIPASSNVSNSMVCFFVGTVAGPPENWGGYEKYLLVGFDYSWRPSPEAVGLDLTGIKTGKYYAFEDPKPKRFYMNHRTVHDINGDWCHTSENLYFSAKWMWSYTTGFGLPLVNCSGRGLLNIPLKGVLSKELESVNIEPSVVKAVRKSFDELQAATKTLAAAREQFEKSREVTTYGRR